MKKNDWKFLVVECLIAGIVLFLVFNRLSLEQIKFIKGILIILLKAILVFAAFLTFCEINIIYGKLTESDKKSDDVDDKK